MYSIQKRWNCLLHFAHRAHADFFFFCGSINLKMISTVECLLQTQIHGKKTHRHRQKSNGEHKATWQSESLKNLGLYCLSLELLYHGWGQVISLGVLPFT